MFDHLLESSHRDDSNKRSNIGIGKEVTQVESNEVNFLHLIQSRGSMSSVENKPLLQIFYSVQHFSNANFLISQPIPML